MTLQVIYKRLEQILIFFMVLGILAMFQPWFRSAVEFVQPLFTASEDVNFGRIYKDDWAPAILRFGFYSTFIATVFYVSMTHYTVDVLERAEKEKGRWLMLIQIALPILAGFAVLYGLAFGHYWSAILYVGGFVVATSSWNGRRWGIIGLGIVSVLVAILMVIGQAHVLTSVIFIVFALAVIGLSVPIWDKYN